MPLLQKLFHTDRRRRQRSFRLCGKEASPLSPEKLTSYKWWNVPEFDPGQIRLVVFTDNDVTKKLRFDSKTVKCVDTGQCRGSPSAASCAKSKVRGLLNHSQGEEGDRYQYERGRPSPDEKLLAEMLFGSVAMSYKGSMTKVHSIKSPPQLMLSRVFQLSKVKASESDQDEKDSISLYGGEGTTPQSIRNPYQSESQSIAHSIPVAIPAHSPYHSHDEDSSDFSTSGSFLGPSPSPGSLSSGTTTPNNSLHRRWLRNQLTSMEYVARKKSTDALSSDSPVTRKRKPKIGVSIVISLPEPGDLSHEQFKTFFFSHFSFMEHHFLRLCDQIEKILVYSRKTLLKSSMEAVHVFRSTISAVYAAPRIQQPIWLNMMSYPQQRSTLCSQLIKILVCELDTHNNKSTNFFVARLLTAVLTHHLAWVPTVMPSDSTPSRAYLDKHSSTLLDLLAQSHPYNPLWAQLGDLYGAIGHPNKIARTIVVGRRADVVCRLLYLLSYFIRCSEVHERDLHCSEFTVHFDPEGHIFTWSLSLDESSNNDFEESTAVSDQSSAARTDSGFAEGHDGLSRDNVSLCLLDDSVSLGEEASAVERLHCCQRCPSCLNEGGAKLCKLGGIVDREDAGFHTDVTHDGMLQGNISVCDRTETDFQQTMDCQSLCSSVTVGSDDSTASTVCDEAGVKIAVGNRAMTPLSAGNVPPKSQETTTIATETISTQDYVSSQEGRTKTIVQLCKAGNMQDVASEEAFQVQRVSNAGETVIKIHDDVQYAPKVECSVPVGRAATSNREGARSDYGNVLLQQPLPESLKDTYNTQQDTTGCRCICQGQNDVSNNVLRTKGPPNPVKTCRQCYSSSNKPSTDRSSSGIHSQTAESQEYPSVFNSSREEALLNSRDESSRSRHSSGQTDRGTSGNAALLRGISSVSECSLTSSTITCKSESTVGDQEELPLAVQHSRSGGSHREAEDTHFSNIGRSMLGGYSQHYVPDLALHGTQSLDLSQVQADMVSSAEHSVLDEPTAEAVCIVANTDKWTVELVSSEQQRNPDGSLGREVTTSHMVQTLLESVQTLSHETGRKMEADFYLMHLEDRLQEMYFSSLVLASYLERNPAATTKELSLNLGLEVSDLELLMSVTSVHSPHVIMSVLRESYERSSPEGSPPCSLSSNPEHA